MPDYSLDSKVPCYTTGQQGPVLYKGVKGAANPPEGGPAETGGLLAEKRFLLAFISSYKVEPGFSHVHYLLSKQRNTFKIELRDVRLKLKNLRPNIPQCPPNPSFP